MTQALRIMHCLRAPVGGLFRHVRDLAKAQADAGHEVGVVCDSRGGDPLTESRLEAMKPFLALGLARVPMSREIGWRDFTALHQIRKLATRLDVDILHGHGAKGGAYARLSAAALKRKGCGLAAFYTPHGGSLHYDPRSPVGRIYMALEHRLARYTDGLIFESAFAARTYAAKVGAAGIPTRVIANGLLPEEFIDVVPDADAADFLFVGELRRLKGVDVLLEALRRVNSAERATAVIVGAGPDGDAFKALADELGVASLVRFAGAMTARDAFKLARVLVMPSRAESFPYVALEAGAAGIPLIATRVGGLPEIVSGTDTDLVPPEDDARLAAHMLEAKLYPRAARERAKRLQDQIATRFTVCGMSAATLDFYTLARAATARTSGGAEHQARLAPSA